jgi:hypothetical protein
METKALYFCTLWGQTFDSSDVRQIFDNSGSIYICLSYGRIQSPYFTIREFPLELLKAIQAIASAQRPWLKAEGFQFKDDCFYRIKLGDSPHILTGLYDEPNNLFYVSELYEGGKDFSIPTIWVTAFKPANDSEEAWNAVAGVKIAS